MATRSRRHGCPNRRRVSRSSIRFTPATVAAAAGATATALVALYFAAVVIVITRHLRHCPLVAALWTSQIQATSTGAASRFRFGSLFVQVEAQVFQLKVVFDQFLLAAVKLAQFLLISNHLQQSHIYKFILVNHFCDNSGTFPNVKQT